ncbi:site-specific DNA-methyltransferase [Pseudooceanicola sp.]|uniref:site-specific DNA-methyltransferase n=1 Tax=Pseudooceanicola sp. TaxID=1914328 RepID=UPI0035190B98
MSRLTDLIAQAKSKDADLGRELEREFKALASRRSFGLNFERHTPETVELPGRPIRKGDKVRILPPRGSTDQGDKRLWKVVRTSKEGGARVAQLDLIGADEPETQRVAVEDLIVVAEFRDYIYPGLVSTGKVERGGDKPFHTVINGENFHALEALTFTHRGKVDVIYIDPPYNTGAKDWKYNNDYVEGDDLYRHSKWLAFMERRLKLARELLEPRSSCLIITIDEKEYLRLGMLLEQSFPESTIQMVTSLIKPSGSQRTGGFSRVEEYIFCVMIGSSSPSLHTSDMLRDTESGRKANNNVTWHGLRRRGSTDWRRETRPNGFYPLHISLQDGKLVSVGEPLPLEADRQSYQAPEGTFAGWPLDPNGEDSRWQISPDRLRKQLERGTAALRDADPETGTASVVYLKSGDIKRVENGELKVVGRSDDGRIITEAGEGAARKAKTMWTVGAHDASAHGTALLSRFVPTRKFPFPKSLYAVEDAIRFFVLDKPEATILDFFSGSGTTAHAVMRLNKQDGGRRQCISVTNNEVAADEQKALTKVGLRPGDPDWEKWGICDYITKPRIKAAITGQTPDGSPVKGDYKFTDEFPMADGFEENAEFFTLTYETPVSISHNRAFARIAPLLWMRAGSEGRRIDALPGAGWEVADTYGLLTDLDAAAPFVDAVEAKGGIRIAYIVTDDDRRFQSVAQRLPEGVEVVRLYESYLTNFRFSMGR